MIFGSINKITKILEPPLKEDVTISIFTILLGTNDTLFAKLVDGNGKELFDYTPSAKFLISMLFKNETGNEKTIQRIADGNEALALLGVDMESWNEGSNFLNDVEFPDNPCHLILKFNANKINSTNQCDIFLNNNQSKINRFELRTNLYDLACNINEHTEHNKKFKTQNNVCKFKSGDRNLLGDWNSANLTLCYESRLGEHVI
uniref:Uncharacterized protein n=1 Tax=Meloidogyne incognita TaxID=6306 RepID=A0A914NAY7_MELIC